MLMKILPIYKPQKHNTQLSGVGSWRADCECKLRDGLLYPCDRAAGGGTASTACYVAPVNVARCAFSLIGLIILFSFFEKI